MIASTDSQIALVGTNIVVYAFDLDDPHKHTIAGELIEQFSNPGRLVWSTQVFNDFCSVMVPLAELAGSRRFRDGPITERRFVPRRGNHRLRSTFRATARQPSRHRDDPEAREWRPRW